MEGWKFGAQGSAFRAEALARDVLGFGLGVHGLGFTVKGEGSEFGLQA